MGAEGGVAAAAGWVKHSDVFLDESNTSLVLTFRSLLLDSVRS